MTDNEINRAIALFLGWRRAGRWVGINPDGVWRFVPNYCREWEAMHKALNQAFPIIVRAGMFQIEYENGLSAYLMTKPPVAWWHRNEPPRIQAEAFLRACDRWEGPSMHSPEWRAWHDLEFRVTSE